MLHKKIRHFSALTGTDVHLLDVATKSFESDANSFCSRCPRRCDYKNTHLYGCYESVRWDHKYIYCCPMDFTFVAVPVMGEYENPEKGVIIGPVLMGELSDFEETYGLPHMETPRVNDLTEVASALFSPQSGERAEYTGDFLNTVYQELDVENPGSIRWTAKVGQEVQEGQVLGTCQGVDVVCQYNGKLLAINSYGTEPYLEIQLLSPLTMECYVNRSTLKTMQRAKNLTTKDGTAVTIDYVSNIPDPGGNLRVLLSLDTDYYYYGETVNGLQLHTGNQYTQALVLPASALYQKTAGEDQPWYVYKVRADGEAIGEIEVTIGYNNGSYVCVSGIQAGEYFDTGYGAIKGES